MSRIYSAREGHTFEQLCDVKLPTKYVLDLSRYYLTSEIIEKVGHPVDLNDVKITVWVEATYTEEEED
jgi:hypothetical protein